ncbi:MULTISPECIES: flagellar basal body rod protein FlgC [unclassified Thiobacillus]|jgi:flagellar basal-body rod protein FlgC|uniref:flagellar basal body rod protein FlgC n=1 Tax=unclassified Thiobacillus TaxID=2646513 RepID=UPI000868FF1A|nr:MULTISPECIES: flagellar basal body rod protein FlgC [unclassified Thiobacillus]MBS0311079.1 flagellar basal body rod protein FlgC [Pseudomonadota bacterium]OGU42084.1 MAG: flagellar basal body rod protein FlgC [Hydrogenophilales bacterium RIFOXYA1_FULL_63_33]MBC2731717.1 flagellar basal body rod protein FlgC [Thiobacillus sp.]MBC2740455.1 flagellar basal body rod protein FlgC [Thiobacillus sp.]MBC2759137.1 flagellar basal body rod protein FlgC [Thiobacillus sp.]
MSLSNIFSVAGSAMNAQSQRLNTVASNLANADSATSADGTPYKAKQVVFAATPVGENGATGVNVAAVVEDQSPMKQVYDPKNPLADEKGYVTMPNVNVVEEMVNMISASRSYQSNVDMMNTTKTLLLKTLSLGQ